MVFIFSNGTYPSCTCQHPLQYDALDNLCVECPENASGIYPKCECNNGVYLSTSNVCIVCPINSTGTKI